MTRVKKELQVVHALPGRVRLKLHRLKYNPSYAADIQRDLLKISGILHLEANPQTGSLLIEYDPDVLDVLVPHPSVSSCLDLPLFDPKQSKKVRPSAKSRGDTFNTGKESSTKRVISDKPKKSSK